MKRKENTFGDEKPEDSLGYLVWQISHIRQRKINLALGEIDLTYPQFVLLLGIHWLKQNDENVNQVQLIRFTKMDKSVVSSILMLLEKKRIIFREIDKKDTRAKVLELGKKGTDSKSVYIEQSISLTNRLKNKMGFLEEVPEEFQGYLKDIQDYLTSQKPNPENSE